MYSIPIQENVVVVTAASAAGELTCGSNVGLYPGTFGWLSKDDGSVASMYVEIVRLVGSTKMIVRQAPDGTGPMKPGPSYGATNVSAFTGGASKLTILTQTAPVNLANTPRQIG